MVAVKAHFDSKVIVLDEPVDLPKGKPLLVQIDVVQPPKPPKPAKKPKRRRKGQSVWNWLAENAVDDANLPTDLAHQHDHYLYGTPKKPHPGS